MSRNLCWRPERKSYRVLSTALKWAFEKRETFDCTHKNILSDEDIAYLQGLRDAAVEDAQTLIDAINKHGRIEIWLQ